MVCVTCAGTSNRSRVDRAQPVQARHDQHIARIEPAEKLGQLGAVGLSSARLLTVHLGTARGFQLPSSALPPYMRDLITPADYGFSRIAMVGAVLRPFPAGALPRQLPRPRCDHAVRAAPNTLVRAAVAKCKRKNSDSKYRTSNIRRASRCSRYLGKIEPNKPIRDKRLNLQPYVTEVGGQTIGVSQ